MIYTSTNTLSKCAEKFEEGFNTLMTIKRNDELLEKSIAESLDASMAKLNDQLLELNNWIRKLQSAGELAGRMEKATEIKAAMEKLIESLKRKVKKYRDAEAAERKRREQQMQWIEYCVDAMIAQFSKGI